MLDLSSFADELAKIAATQDRTPEFTRAGAALGGLTGLAAGAYRSGGGLRGAILGSTGAAAGAAAGAYFGRRLGKDDYRSRTINDMYEGRKRWLTSPEGQQHSKIDEALHSGVATDLHKATKGDSSLAKSHPILKRFAKEHGVTFDHIRSGPVDGTYKFGLKTAAAGLPGPLDQGPLPGTTQAPHGLQGRLRRPALAGAKEKMIQGPRAYAPRISNPMA